MIVEGFFKLLELRRCEGGKEEESERRKGRNERFVCVWLLEKKMSGYDFSPWVRLNKDDTNGFKSLNYYILRLNTMTLIWLSSMG